MFLLVYGRHVGAHHQDGHQHGVSIQISINCGEKVSPHILHKNNCCLPLMGSFNTDMIAKCFVNVVNKIHEARVFLFVLCYDVVY